jgi:SAM-dependent methyltransferase
MSVERAAGAPDEPTDVSLRAAIPESARRILEIGCRPGGLGGDLKRLDPTRTVYGIARDPKAAEASRELLDRVFEIDVERESPPVEAGEIDCIVYHGVLEEMADPVSVLRRHRALLSEQGLVLCAIRNAQHYAVIEQLLRGDLGQETAATRLFTLASAMKMLLDADYEPNLVERIDHDAPEEFIAATRALFLALRADPTRGARYLHASQLVVSGRPRPEPSTATEVPLTFVACVNDDAQLEANLLSSPCLRAPSPHQVLLFRDRATAADGLNAGIAQAVNDLVVLVHQDVYLPEGWPARLVGQWQRAAGQGRPVGVAGVFGLTDELAERGRRGRVVDREHLLASDAPLPADVDVIDELVMVVPRETTLRLDPSLAWHLYGLDLCLSARAHGERVVVLDALCFHNSQTEVTPPEYQLSEDVIARKWPERLPIRALCSVIGSDSTDRQLAELEAEQIRLQETLHAERETARLEREEAGLRIAAMEASPFWRARTRYARLRDRLRRR